jgi:hypothetical protein
VSGWVGPIVAVVAAVLAAVAWSSTRGAARRFAAAQAGERKAMEAGLRWIERSYVEHLNALRQSRGADTDYHVWSGRAEAYRQAAEHIRSTCWWLDQVSYRSEAWRRANGVDPEPCAVPAPERKCSGCNDPDDELPAGYVEDLCPEHARRYREFLEAEAVED